MIENEQMTLDTREAYRPGSPHWGCMVCPAAIVKEPMHVSDHLRDPNEDDPLQAVCPDPRCGFAGSIDGFGVLGADEGHLFCNVCGTEFPWKPGPELKQGELFE